MVWKIRKKKKTIASITGGKYLRENVYKNGIRVKMLSFNLKTVRYADVFVVIGPRQRVIEPKKFFWITTPQLRNFSLKEDLDYQLKKLISLRWEVGKSSTTLGYTCKNRKNWNKKKIQF